MPLSIGGRLIGFEPQTNLKPERSAHNFKWTFWTSDKFNKGFEDFGQFDRAVLELF